MTHNTGQFTCQGCYVLPLNNKVCNVREKIIFITGSYIFRVHIILIRGQMQACVLHHLANFFDVFPSILERPIIFTKILSCSELNRFSLSRQGALPALEANKCLPLVSHQQQDAVHPPFESLSS